jgi:hypothetical protein
MTSLGKRILSAFVEVREDKTTQDGQPMGRQGGPAGGDQPMGGQSGRGVRPADDRFGNYFDQLLAGANIPGPDYYEFSKMIGAMQAIPDEQARFRAAYAGLQAQGLDREKLLSTAGEYLLMLTTDADHFLATAGQAMQEKVHSKAAALKEKNDRIVSLTQEIKELQDQIFALQTEIKENEEKIDASTAGYTAENGNRKARIQDDMEKIKHYIL